MPFGLLYYKIWEKSYDIISNHAQTLGEALPCLRDASQYGPHSPVKIIPTPSLFYFLRGEF